MTRQKERKEDPNYTPGVEYTCGHCGIFRGSRETVVAHAHLCCRGVAVSNPFEGVSSQ